MIILVDADGVLENHTHVWIEMLNEKYGRTVKYDDVKDWNMGKAYPGLTRDQIYDIELDDRMYDLMQPLDGAKECLEKLLENNNEVYVVTSTPYKALKSKLEKVLFRYYPFLKWKDIIVTSNKKLIKGDVLIDDGVHNLLEGDYKKILVSTPYNESFDAEANNIIRVKNWKEIEVALTQMGAL